jgi:hypothetical protein
MEIDIIHPTKILRKLFKHYEAGETMYNEKRNIIINEGGRHLKIFYVCVLQTAVSAADPKLLMYIQAILCPEECDILG